MPLRVRGRLAPLAAVSTGIVCRTEPSLAERTSRNTAEEEEESALAPSPTRRTTMLSAEEATAEAAPRPA